MKLKPYFLAALFLVFAGATSACKSRSNINNSIGQVQDRHLSGFSSIKLSASFDVYITQGNIGSVKVQAPANKQNAIKTSVNNGVLTITTDHNYSNSGDEWGNDKQTRIYVVVKSINAIAVNGSGNVNFDKGLVAAQLNLSVTGSGDVKGRIDTKTLNAQIAGSGDVAIIGKATTVNVAISGSGDYRCKELITQHTAISLSGSGDAEVHADSRLDAVLNGSGDIRYTGAATQVSTSKNGSGDIERI